jgi:thiol-disulfide isomerase/thioredoxin
MRPILLLGLALLAGALLTPMQGLAADKEVAQQAQRPMEGEFPSLAGATGWLNSPPLTPASLRGKVVLVDFWTLTCINWLRTLPYIRAWAEKYKDQGLVVIGAHTPEFEFEKDIDNVRRAAKEMRVEYPIAVDSNYGVWRAFRNQYWPALYFIDAQGRIRHHQFGEGEYDRAEAVIQQLLAEAGRDAGRDRVSVEGRGIEAPADWMHLESPENYVGYERTQGFASPGGFVQDRTRAYRLPSRLRLNQWALAGEWTVERGAALLNKPQGRIAYRFQARDLHLVLAPSGPGRSIRFRVTIDGAAPGASHGEDVDAEGYGRVEHGRLYQLIRQHGTIEERSFEIEFLDPGVRAYAFTFG